MTESDLRSLRQFIRNELAQIVMASINDNGSEARSSIKRFPNDGPITNLRSIQPFGVSSRAPKGTDCLVNPVNGDVTHLVVAGHFDANKPKIDSDGEACLYGADGQVVYMKSGGTIHQGSKAASEPVVLGNVLKAFEDAILSAWIDNVSQVAYDGFGLPCILSPAVSSVLQSEKATHVDAPATNFLGQKNFVERGA